MLNSEQDAILKINRPTLDRTFESQFESDSLKGYVYTNYDSKLAVSFQDTASPLFSVLMKNPLRFWAKMEYRFL